MAAHLIRLPIALAIAIGSIAFVGESSVEAGMVQYLPAAHVAQVTVKYEMVASGTSKVGRLRAYGAVDTYTLLNGTTVTPSSGQKLGTFSLKLFFDSSGNFLSDCTDNSLKVTGYSADGISGQTLFSSSVVYKLSTVFSQTGLTFEALWQKLPGTASGSLPATSTLPFIGSLVASGGALSYSSGVNGLSFSTLNRADNSLLFTNNPNSLMAAPGSANVFMTPTPTAAFGGVLLIGSLIARRARRPKSGDRSA